MLHYYMIKNMLYYINIFLYLKTNKSYIKLHIIIISYHIPFSIFTNMYLNNNQYSFNPIYKYNYYLKY